MRDKIQNIVNSKLFHISIIIIIISCILFALGIIVLKYNVEGEKNMPFELSKISIISTADGIDIDSGENRWAFDICQSNDIYLYINKNEQYEKTKAIKSIYIDNFQIEALNKENIKIYKPDSQEEKLIFKYRDENIVDSIEYLGDMESDLKNLSISNQGGIVAFRCANKNVAQYKSDEEEIKHTELLKKANINNEDLKINLSFDLYIKLEDGKEFKSTINLELPQGNVVEEGVSSIEITDLQNIIFKRIKN